MVCNFLLWGWFPDPGIKPASLVSPALAGRFFTTEPPGKPQFDNKPEIKRNIKFPGGSDCKESAAMQETWVQSLGWEDPLEKEMATHSNILAWRILWTKDLDWLQSMGSQRVRHD